MAIMNYTFQIDLTDIDEMGNLTNGAILKYLQESGALHSDHVGLGLNDIPKTGLTWILMNWKLQIITRPNWTSKIHVKTWCTKVEKIHTYRDFEIYDEQQNLVAKASSKWILFNIRTNRMERNLESFIDRYELEPTFVFSEFNEKLKEPESYDIRKDFPVLKRDIDTNHHVNNISYLKFAYEVLPEEAIHPDFNEIEIMYKSSTLLGEDYAVLVKKENENHYMVTIKSTDLKTLHTVLSLKRSS